MITSHIIDEFDPSDKRVQITFVNHEGLIHKRYINIPHLEDGSLDQSSLEDIINSQIKSCDYKEEIGALVFIDPETQSGITTN
jgi:hypothetical protein